MFMMVLEVYREISKCPGDIQKCPKRSGDALEGDGSFQKGLDHSKGFLNILEGSTWANPTCFGGKATHGVQAGRLAPHPHPAAWGHDKWRKKS